MINRFLKAAVLGASAVQAMIFLAKTFWVFELFTHYRVYYVVLGAILLTALLLRRLWIWAALLAFLILLNLASLWPYLTTQKNPTDGELKILSQNMFYLNHDLEALRPLIAKEDPDLFVIVEANSDWLQEGEHYLAEYPFQSLTTQTGVHGVFMASKKPGTFTELGPDLQFTPEVGDYKVLGVHPAAPINKTEASSRNESLGRISQHVQTSENWIVIGDFNCTPWSPQFTELLQTANLKDSRLGFGLTPTWNVKNLLFKIPIDHALVSQAIQVTHFKKLPKIGSDHFGILVELNFY